MAKTPWPEIISEEQIHKADQQEAAPCERELYKTVAENLNVDLVISIFSSFLATGIPIMLQASSSHAMRSLPW